MVDAAPGAGSSQSYGKLNKIPNLVKTIIIIAILAVVAYFIWNHFHNNSQSSTSNNKGVLSIAQLDQASQKQASEYLNTNDFTSYQFDRQDLASEYLAGKDYSNAERVMDEVLKNVPQNKITERSYSVLFQIEKAKGNVTLEKKYLSLMIAGLKQEGKTDTATAAQQELDQLK